jgi:hypothetical protein
MGSIILILTALLCLAGFSGTAAAAPKVAADGKTLILEPGKTATKKDGSGDTLYELLGKEVQVFIFNNKTRVWPKVYTRSGSAMGWSGRTWPNRINPQLEPIIQKYSQAYGVDPSLVRAVVRHESGFNSNAVSPKGAQGLMQLMPGTAALMGVRDPFDPEQNIAGGVGYLRRCLDRFQHNVPLAVAAYNAGPERVAQCGAVPPIAETQLFVNNVMGTYAGPAVAPASTAAKAAPAPAANARKGKTLKTAAVAADTPQEQPRRRKAKIIEVRSHNKFRVVQD